MDYDNYEDNYIENSRKIPFVTVTILGINLLVYIVLEFIGSTLDSEFMVSCGALTSYKVIYEGEYHRLLTSFFLHFGPEHIFNNMLSLFLIGGETEKHIGHIKFAIIYFAAGLSSSIVSLIMHFIYEPYIISAGASGAIMGIGGALVVILLTNRLKIDKNRGIRFLIFLGLSILSGFTSSTVDNAGHIGGLFAGLIIMLLFTLFSYIRKKLSH